MPRAKKETTERKDRRDTPYISPKRAAYRKMIARVRKTEGLWGYSVLDEDEINYIRPTRRVETEDETF